MTEQHSTRRDFLAATAALAALPLLPIALRNDAPQPVPPEKPIDHLPADFEDLFSLSTEQKILLAAAVASGGDAVAYYTPGQMDAFKQEKKIDLYPWQQTQFKNAIQMGEAEPEGYWQLPVANPDTKRLKGFVLIHRPTTVFDKEEPEYATKAKRRMAQDILNEHADLFGVVDKAELGKREAKHRSLESKQKFFLRLVKDFFATLAHKDMPEGDVTQQRLKNIEDAQDAKQLKAALRACDKWADSDQHSHVLGVTDLMEFAIEKAINAKERIIGEKQENLILLLTLLHDVGKTQIPAQLTAPRPDGDKRTDELETQRQQLLYTRNGSHPLFTLLTLLMYDREAIVSATHHNGVKRYGGEEIKFLRDTGKADKAFDRFTALTGKDIAPEKLPALSRIMRIVDVAEAITSRTGFTLASAVTQLGTKGKEGDYRQKVRELPDGSFRLTPDSADPHSLCLLLNHGVFDAYGERREEQNKAVGGWLLEPGKPEKGKRYNKEELAQARGVMLKTYAWDEAKEATLLQEIKDDALLRDNPERGRGR